MQTLNLRNAFSDGAITKTKTCEDDNEHSQACGCMCIEKTCDS